MIKSSPKKIKCSSSTLKWRDDGIMEVTITKKGTLELHEHQELVEAVGMLSSGRKVPILVILNNEILPSLETRKFMASEESVIYTKARAFIVKSLAHRIVGNFIIRVQTPKVPVQMFVDEKKAVKWLQNFL